MVRGAIDIKRLNMDELLGVVSIYPWYGGARMELCRRLSESGTLSPELVSQAALFVGSRSLLYKLVNSAGSDYSDSDVSTLLERVLGGGKGEAPAAEVPAPEAPAGAPARIFVVGGDYFSASQYREVRRSEDSVFSSFASADKEGLVFEEPEEGFDLCTETLAGIYAEQGYINEAKQIYSKLSLRYPEKSVYFAALIEKLDKN
ncbi:MAG: hypothetical protein J6S97_02520 [Bacteroidales bacterium]|nr:hypothetical protein [Bacteroidales bacterium]